MKKLLTLFTILFALLCTVPQISYADSTTYLKVTHNDVKLYCLADSEEAVYFSLIKDCYVKFIDAESGKYKVSYMDVIGYVDTQSVSAPSGEYVDLKQPYHNSKTVTTNSATYILEDPATVRNRKSIDSGTSLTVIGVYNDQYIYVRTSNDIEGYVLSSTTDFVNDLSAPSAEVNATTTTDTQSEANSDALRVILILGICVPATLVVYLIFKPMSKSSRNRGKARRYIEDDYGDYPN